MAAVQGFKPSDKQNYKSSEEAFLKAVDKALSSITTSLTISKKTHSGSSVTIDSLANNTVHECTDSISELVILSYPAGNFVSTVLFSTATSGTIKVVFPTGTKFAGSASYEFFPAENWELNIHNGVVAGSQLF